MNDYLRQWHTEHPEKAKIYAHDNYLRHRVKKLEQRAEWRKKNPEYFHIYNRKFSEKLNESARDRAYKSKYGISLEDYNRLSEAQRGLCALCLRPSMNKKLAVDHDHKTGRIRGLLCVVCNRIILGRIDSIEGFWERLIEYKK